MSHPSVSVVIANWNGKDFLGPCLASLAALDYPPDRLEIIVIDNCSSDRSVEYLRECHPGVVVIENDVNNYARANNRGIAATNSDYVALLNTDTRVDPGWLRALVERLESNANAAAVGSKVLFMDGKINSAGVKSLPDYHWADLGFREDDRGQFDTPTTVEGISGCSVLIRRSAFDAVGPYDEDFQMYYEDVDYSLRLRAAGFELLYEPGSVVHHKYNGSIEKIPRSGQKDWYGERNRLFVVARHFPKDLARVAVRSRFFLYSSADEFGHALPLLAKKWDAASSDPKHDLVELLSSAKTEITRLQAEIERTGAGVEKRDAVIGEIQQRSQRELDLHKKLVEETRERLEGELAAAHERYSKTIGNLEAERDEVRHKYSKILADAHADRDRARTALAETTASLMTERDDARAAFAETSEKLQAELAVARTALDETTARLQAERDAARAALAETTERLQAERDTARAALAETTERLQAERDAARAALAAANQQAQAGNDTSHEQATALDRLREELSAARNAHGQEQRTRREREVWIIALLRELKPHRQLSEDELKFIQHVAPSADAPPEEPKAQP